MQVQCPFCERRYKCSEEAAGKQVQCVNLDCQHFFTASLKTTNKKKVRETVLVSSSPDSMPNVGDGNSPPPPLPSVSEVANLDKVISYKKRSRLTVFDVKQKFKNGINLLRKRIRQWTLTRDIENLYMTIDEQCECLGRLVFQHRPAEIDISVETAELSKIQEDLAQKQITLEALQETKHSNSVGKELKQEIVQQEDRQSVLMIALGRRTEKPKIDMPGSTGHYSALERLRPSLEMKKTELRVLQKEISPMRGKKPLMLRSFKKPLIIIGSMVIGLVILYGLWGIVLQKSYIGLYISSEDQDHKGFDHKGFLEIMSDGTYRLEEEYEYNFSTTSHGKWEIDKDGITLYRGHSRMPEMVCELEGNTLIDQLTGKIWIKQ